MQAVSVLICVHEHHHWASPSLPAAPTPHITHTHNTHNAHNAHTTHNARAHTHTQHTTCTHTTHARNTHTQHTPRHLIVLTSGARQDGAVYSRGQERGGGEGRERTWAAMRSEVTGAVALSVELRQHRLPPRAAPRVRKALVQLLSPAPSAHAPVCASSRAPFQHTRTHRSASARWAAPTQPDTVLRVLGRRGGYLVEGAVAVLRLVHPLRALR